MFDRQFYIRYKQDEIEYDNVKFNKFIFNKLIIHYSKLISINSCKNSNLEVCAIGDLIFPYKPTYTSKDIVEKILYKCKSLEDIIDMSNKFSGRYVIIVSIDNSIYFIPDCFALMGIYYAKIKNKKIISSNPKLLLNVLNENRQLNNDYNEFLQNEESKKLEYQIYGYTWFDSRIKKVLPNNYLEIEEFKLNRIAVDIIDNKSEDEIINDGINIISGTIEALINRYNVIMPITAGLDSRLLLALSKKYKDQIRYYIFSNPYGFYDMDTYTAKKLPRNLI